MITPWGKFQESSNGKIIHYFTNSSGALLLAVTAVLVISLRAGALLVLPQDPIFQLSLRALYGIFAGFGLVAALVCLFSQKPMLKASLILWITLNATVYVIGVQWQPKGDFSAYLGFVADAFDITPATAFWLAKAMCFYLLIGSGAVLIFGKKYAGSQCKTELAESLGTKADPSQLAAQPVPTVRRPEVLVRTLKISCTACGGHIEFPTNFFGERIPCPHCQAMIILQKSKNFRMSCTACNGHIEFPDHAVGEKILCPHCKMAITLEKSV